MIDIRKLYKFKGADLMLTRKELINTVANAEVGTTIDIDIHGKLLGVFDFNTLADKVLPFSHEIDWDERRTISVDTGECRITMMFSYDSLSSVTIEPKPIDWYNHHWMDTVVCFASDMADILFN